MDDILRSLLTTLGSMGVILLPSAGGFNDTWSVVLLFISILWKHV